MPSEPPIKSQCSSWSEKKANYIVNSSLGRYRTCNLCRLDLLAEDILESNCVSGEFRDTLTELLDGHLVLVEVEAELGLVVDVALLLNVKLASILGNELLGDLILRVVELLEQVGLGLLVNWTECCVLEGVTHGNSQVVAASKFSDLANAAERGTHDNGVVAVLLVVVEDLLDALDTRVLLLGVLLLVSGLVPVKDTANERRDEVSTGLSGSNGLNLREHEGKVAVDTVLGLQDLSSLDALPCRGELDENALLVNASLLVELHRVSIRILLSCSFKLGFF